MNVHAYLETVRKPTQTVNALFALLGMRLEHAANGSACVVLPLRTELTQGGGLIAGGVLATMADEAMAHAALTGIQEGFGIVTIEMNIRYLRPAPLDFSQEIKAKGKVIKRGRHTIFLESSVLDHENNLLATAGASFMIIHPKV